MSHSYVRALALGRPMITNSGAGFDDADAAIVCRDETLEHDLYRYLGELSQSSDLRARLAALSISRYREHHTIDKFFDCVKALNAGVVTV